MDFDGFKGRIAPLSPDMLLALRRREAEAQVLAKTIWGEARGEGIAGQEAVAAVIINRVRRPCWWGRGVAEVCRKPGQFSCWNAVDPNRPRLDRLTDDEPSYATALRIARRALAGVLPDRVSGATHYHAKSVSPRWARKHTPVAEIGNHLFYNDIEVQE